MRILRSWFSGSICLLVCLLAFSPAAESQERPQDGKGKTKARGANGSLSVADPTRLSPIEPVRLEIPPVIDGILDDPAWKAPPLRLGDWLTYNPAYGEKTAQKTEVWIAYDKRYLYLAFRCLDPEPDKIKTSIARRDTVWNDDWVGMSLDALGTGQSAYELFVNPSGVQGDILRTSTQGEDSAPDWVWDSAGKPSDEGYAAEIRIPLESIRFKSGKIVRMGVLFWRRVSRLGVSSSWPDLPRGQSVFTRQAPLLFHDLEQPRMLEVIPNFTYSLRQDRVSPDAWGAADSKPDAGLTVKYGITSSLTLDGTIRPDFSQVESDSFQVEVNQRFPTFYSEKRPFFMEGMGTFELAGAGGDGNMRTAVHTRRIIDPLFGVKLTGSAGRFTFATLSASDRAAGRLDASDPHFGERKNFNIVRALYNVGKGSYAGALYTDTEFGGGYNRVGAADVSLRIGEHQEWSATVIGSDTRPIDGSGTRRGMAAQTLYSYTSKRFESSFQLEHYDRDFQMDTGFYNRTGITGGWGYSGLNFYPAPEWLKRINPFVFVRAYHDRIQGGNDRIYLAGLRMYFTRQGYFRIHTVRGREPWTGRMFDIRATEIQGQAQIVRWLNVSSNLSLSRSIYYDPEDPFAGNEKYFSADVTFQPDSRLNQTVGIVRDAFDRLSGGDRVYTVDIINSRTSYQLTRRLSVRAIAQYDSSRTRVLTDFLGSYELVPGTVAYAGYGALYERSRWDGRELVKGAGGYLNTERGLFFKVSYLHRF